MGTKRNGHTITFLIQCSDKKGLVASISSFFYKRDFNVLSCQQYTDLLNKKYYMRLQVALGDLTISRKQLEKEFEDFGKPFDLKWSVHYSDNVQKAAILVSRTSHCLYDLLLRWKENEIDCEIPVIVSNHPTLEAVADQFRVPFHCLPIVNGDKSSQENQIRQILRKNHIDLVVLARYMQVLSPQFINEYDGRIINIHHAFLPAFQGGKPYDRAHERGVKMIGATAHYATEELDEGPIIEQDVERVNHEMEPESLKQIGSDIERIVLSRAVKAHLERRIIVSGRRTIVFSQGL
jgi:formyltetrahydrofolate deformylase